jgi:hypothetical protein
MIIFIVLVIKNKNIMEKNVLSVVAMVIRMVTIIWLSLFNI